MLQGTCLEEAKLLLVKTQKFGQSLQSLLPMVKGVGFANIRGSGVLYAAAQLSGELQDGRHSPEQKGGE